MTRAYLACEDGAEPWLGSAIGTACCQLGWELVRGATGDARGSLQLSERSNAAEADVVIVVAPDLSPGILAELKEIQGLEQSVLLVDRGTTLLPCEFDWVTRVAYTGQTEADLVGQLLSHAPRQFFGYLYYETDGFERILVRRESDGRWSLPFTGTIACGKDPGRYFSELVRRALEQKAIAFDAFHSANFSSVAWQEISYGKDAETPAISPSILFKVKLQRPFALADVNAKARFAWVRKVPLLHADKLSYTDASTDAGAVAYESSAPAQPTIANLLRGDRVLNEYGVRILECVDVLVFHQEKPEDDPKFLLLQRRKGGRQELKWEYPKGGLENHESIREGAIRELLEETSAPSIGEFRFGGYLGIQTPNVAGRKDGRYDALRVNGVTFAYIGDPDKLIEHVREHRQSVQAGDASLLLEGFEDAEWVSWDEAVRRIWMPESGYPKVFLSRWKDDRVLITRRIQHPVSLVYQSTEACPHTCKYCHRRKVREPEMTSDAAKHLIDALSARGILRLTISGGEPLSLGKDYIFELIGYANAKRIHVCLSSTGIYSDDVELTEADIRRLEPVLDHLLISINAVNEDTAASMYRDVGDWQCVIAKSDEILKWTRNSPIRVEVCTVVTRGNHKDIADVGRWIFARHENAFWRIDEYYANGEVAAAKARDPFELDEGDFRALREEIERLFPVEVAAGRIRFNTKESRAAAPDVMITPGGKLVTSSENRYEAVGDITQIESWNFGNRRSYEDYRRYCRDWEWDTQWDWESASPAAGAHV